MSDTVFAIIEGEYSDWRIIGYLEDEEDANKFCAVHNNKCYVEPIPKISCDFGDGIYFQWRCVFELFDGDEEEIREIYLIRTAKQPIEPMIEKSGWSDRWCGYVDEIVFSTLQMDAEKAEKIAFDHYARLKYQKEVNA